MTLTEYQCKLSNLMSSDAPIEQKEEAIETLRSQYETSSSTEVARQQFEEAQPDTSDIGDHL